MKAAVPIMATTTTGVAAGFHPHPGLLHTHPHFPQLRSDGVRRHRAFHTLAYAEEETGYGKAEDGAMAQKDVRLVVEDLRRRRRIRKLGVGSGVGFLGVAAALDSALTHTPLPVVTMVFLLSLLVGYTKQPVKVASAPLKLGKDVEVRPTSGKGLGLFALHSIEKDTYICDYKGEILDEIEFLSRYPPDKQSGASTSDYVVDLTQGDMIAGDPEYVDAIDPAKSNFARYMNHGSDSAACNVRRRHQHFPKRILRFFAARDIVPGEELQFDYGPRYWQGRENAMVR